MSLRHADANRAARTRTSPQDFLQRRSLGVGVLAYFLRIRCGFACDDRLAQGCAVGAGLRRQSQSDRPFFVLAITPMAQVACHGCLWHNLWHSCHTAHRGFIAMATLNISIPDSMREWIDAQVAAGGYANASDYIRDLVRHNQRERELIQLALIEGERSGVSERSVNDIARQAKRRLQRAQV
jgi:antitoxin ParD1/3/4